MRRTLTFASLATLALLLVAAARENYFSAWRGHQREFKRILLSKARNPAEQALAARFTVEIRQVVVPDLGTVDRCVSCHLGFDDPRMSDVPQPYTFHPGGLLDSHDIDRFGCTACHGGQGRATTKREAHANVGEVFWEPPLIPPAVRQSSCGVCHDPDYLEDRGAPVLARGLQLYRESGCSGCHALDGRGGSLGPPLDRLGDRSRHTFPFARVKGERTVWNWHLEHILNPQDVVPGSKMMKFEFSDRDVQALTTYLLSLRSSNLTERMTPPDKYKERSRKAGPSPLSGGELYRQICHVCHGEGLETYLHDTLGVAVPAIRNPDFLAVSSDDFLFRNIRDGRTGTAMPAWGGHTGGLSDQEIRRLVAYLVENRQEKRSVAFVPSRTIDVTRGKRLFEENCMTCHSTTRTGGESSWLGSPEFQATYSDALMGHTIKYGRAETLMNPYGKEAGGDLTDQEISDVIGFIRTLK